MVVAAAASANSFIIVIMLDMSKLNKFEKLSMLMAKADIGASQVFVAVGVVKEVAIQPKPIPMICPTIAKIV